MRNIKLSLKYDGNNYHGWQSQKNAKSVQQMVESAISQIAHEKITVFGCSRTDAGVHALKYVCNFQTNSDAPIDKIQIAMNSLLPHDISVFECAEVHENFHARYDTKSKTYIYKILNSSFRDPFYANYSYFCPFKINLSKMQRACKFFIGRRDFSAFTSKGSNPIDNIREIYYLHISKKGDIITMEITAKGFLYKMARIIAGTLLYVGLGKIDLEKIPEIIEKKDRKYAGKTLSANGLYLKEIIY